MHNPKSIHFHNITMDEFDVEFGVLVYNQSCVAKIYSQEDLNRIIVIKSY